MQKGKEDGPSDQTKTERKRKRITKRRKKKGMAITIKNNCIPTVWFVLFNK